MSLLLTTISLLVLLALFPRMFVAVLDFFVNLISHVSTNFLFCPLVYRFLFTFPPRKF